MHRSRLSLAFSACLLGALLALAVISREQRSAFPSPEVITQPNALHLLDDGHRTVGWLTGADRAGEDRLAGDREHLRRTRDLFQPLQRARPGPLGPEHHAPLERLLRLQPDGSIGEAQLGVAGLPRQPDHQ